jgi:hypothetical protein
MLKPGTHSSPSNHNNFEDVDQLDKFAIEINQEVQEHRLRYLFSSFLFIATFDLEVVFNNYKLDSSFLLKEYVIRDLPKGAMHIEQ